MRYASLLALVLAIAISCSSSTDTNGPTYPLQLSIDSSASVNNSKIFYFRVTDQHSKSVSGAKLRRTNFPSGQTYDLGIKSDTAGHFPYVTVVLVDTVSQVAFQAVNNTLNSNYVRWP